MKDLTVHWKWLYLLALLLLAPALWINLGLLAFIDDEAIRSLVALEMKLSGNYITPTLNGEYYYNKPPLFNWILLLFFKAFGAFNEFAARLPTTIAVMGYGGTIYYFFRKHYDVRTSFLNAFVMITCGRILFWDSMLALIDITFSWVTFTSFMVIYHQFRKGNFYQLFIFSYLLTAAGFLMKGLPSIVFQGTTLLVFFIYKKQFRRLFSLAHISGVLLFLLIVGGYYWIYHQYNPLDEVFVTLFNESSKRTVVNYGIWNTILHVLVFPFEMVYHFLPWSLMILFFIRKDIIHLIRKDDFITYNLIIFLANIIVYWTSPEVYPRYLLMLAPLIFSGFIYLHQIHRQEASLPFRLLEGLFLFVCFVIAAASLAPLFLERTQLTSYLYWKTLTWSAGLFGTALIYYRHRGERLIALVLFLLVFRIGFNWFVLPDRNANDYGDLCRDTSIAMGKAFVDRKMFIYRDTYVQPTNAFYLTNARQAIIPHQRSQLDSAALYILYPPLYFELMHEETMIYPGFYPRPQFETLGTFEVRHGRMTFHIARLNGELMK